MKRGLPFLLLFLTLPSVVPAQFQIKSQDEESEIRIGLLAQVQAEWITTPNGTENAKNLFVRRLRLLVGGRLFDRLKFFIETDSPNLGKAAADGVKNEGDIVQSAGTLLPLDYGPTASPRPPRRAPVWVVITAC